jgi:hypothetical protein
MEKTQVTPKYLTDSLKAVRSFEELSNIRRVAQDGQRSVSSATRNGHILYNSFFAIVLECERLDSSLQDDYDAHPFNWEFSEAMQRVR